MKLTWYMWYLSIFHLLQIEGVNFFDDLWKKENLVFWTFNDNLLALNQLLTLVSSLFIFSNKMLMSLCEKKRFVSSANMIGFSTFEVWCKSFTYNRNNKGPKMDPWGTPHVTVTFLVELCSKETNCCRSFK